ncbi:MAG: 4-hydroxy-tetrahydrodipicolinate reductase [Lachnospiraceae bacterium]|nr:4-hydroxy-tetrahydrodipicolinate reductase [Lachnospiraceae bacterium]
MVKILLHGALGRMGKAVGVLAAADLEAEIAAGVDSMCSERDRQAFAYPIYSEIGEFQGEADAVIDFSTAGAVDGLLNYCVSKKLPLVLCTTGLSEEQLAHVREASEKIPILRSANMSLGVNLLCSLLAKAAPLLLQEGFDAEILEKHHNQKLDAPSGTAIALAEAINGALAQPYEIVTDRYARREKRPKKEIGVASLRGGTIVGEHDVYFAGEDEVIAFSHQAASRKVFAKGALAAAKFLKGKEPGMYSMQDLYQ